MYEGEVTEMTPVETENPGGGYGKVGAAAGATARWVLPHPPCTLQLAMYLSSSPAVSSCSAGCRACRARCKPAAREGCMEGGRGSVASLCCHVETHACPAAAADLPAGAAKDEGERCVFLLPFHHQSRPCLLPLPQVVSHVVIGLKTVKGTKQLKLDPSIHDSLQVGGGGGPWVGGRGGGACPTDPLFLWFQRTSAKVGKQGEAKHRQQQPS